MLRIRNVSPLVVAGLLLCSGCACPQFAVRDRVIDSSVASNDGKAVFRANNGGGFGHTDVDCCDEGCDKCDSQIEFGRPHAVIDGVGWIFGIPSKVLL